MNRGQLTRGMSFAVVVLLVQAIGVDPANAMDVRPAVERTTRDPGTASVQMMRDIVVGGLKDAQVAAAGPLPVTNLDTLEQFATIQAAIDDADTLDTHTLEIIAGTHSESDIHVTKDLNIRGQGIGNTIIDIGAGNIGFFPEVDGVTLEDMTIEDGSQAVRLFLASGTIDDTTLQRVEMLNNTSRGVEVHNDTTVTDLVISECEFTSTTVGIRVSSSAHVDGVQFIDSTFTSNDIAIYEANDGGTSTLANMLVTGCTFTDHTSGQGTAIFLEEVQDSVIENNDFVNNRRDVQIFKWYQASVLVSNVDIINNTFTGTTDAHLAIFNAEHSSGQTTFDGVRFENNDCSGSFNLDKGPVYAGGHSSSSSAGGLGWDTVSIASNSFGGVGVGTLAVRFYNPGVPASEVLGGAQLLDTSVNYWGALVPADLAALMDDASVTDFTPLIDNGADQGPDPGYQPDLSVLTVHALGAQAGTAGRVQEGIDEVTDSTVNLAPGTYEEQIVITDDDLELIGSGSGSDPLVDSIVRSPVSLTYFFTTSNDNYPIIGVDGATNVTIDNLRVDGAGRGNSNYRFVGVGWWNAGGTLSDTTITAIRDTPFSGSQHGVGILAANDTGGPYALDVSGCVLSDYQKNGMALTGTGLTVDVSDCTVTGVGGTTVTAQNGIQISGIAGGTITGCTISGHMYTPLSFASAGILLYEASTVDIINGNTISDNFPGVYFQDTEGTFSGNTVSNQDPDSVNGLYVFNASAPGPAPEVVGGGIKAAASPFEVGTLKAAAGTRRYAGGTGVVVSDSRFIGHDKADTWGISAFSTGPAAGLTITNCNILDWDWGVVAYDSGGPVTLDANYNSISSNVTYGFYSDVAGVQDATNNYWGIASGPADSAGVDEAGSPPCFDPATMVNADGLGNAVTDLTVNYCPWLQGAGTMALETPAGCQSDTQLVVELWMRDLAKSCTGFAAFVDFDDSTMTYRGDLSTYTTSPFPLHIQSIATAEVTPGRLNLDGSDAFGGEGTSSDALLATLIFDVAVDCGPTSLSFTNSLPFESELSLEGVPLVTNLVDAVDLALDDTDPVISCPADTSIPCDDLPATGPSSLFGATGATTAGVSVYYNSTGPSDLTNAAYLRTQVDLSSVNVNGGELFFDDTTLLDGFGTTWASIFSGIQPLTQFGLDMIRPLATSDGSVIPPTLTAVDNVDGTPGGATAAGTVSWAINDYKPNSPSGPTTVSNQPANSMLRGPGGGDPLVDIEIVQLELVGPMLIFEARLSADGDIHWYNPAFGTGDMLDFGLTGDLYVSGVLTLAASGSGEDHYAGVLTVTTNAPSVTGFPIATDNCTLLPALSYADVEDLTSCNGTGTIERTWTATDDCGNSSMCTQTITVEDTTAPEITCPDDTTIECDESTDPDNTGLGYLEDFEDAGFTSGGPVIGGDFSTTLDGWSDYNSALTRVASGTAGISSSSGAFHGVFDSTSLPATPDDFTGGFSRLGGYDATYGIGFSTRVDVYMDLSDPAVAADTYGWDISTAVNNQAGSHHRDFIFHTASNASGDILVGGSNNTNFTRRNDLATINHHVITSSGWYTFEWVFRDAGDGSLAVDLNLRDDSDTLLWTETRNDASDVIATEIGGHRYMWFTFFEVDTLAVDNTRFLENPTVGDNCDESPTVTYSDVVAAGSCADEETITRTWMVEDECGNSNSCDQIITVQDTTAPVLDPCPADITVNSDAGGCDAVVTFTPPGASDNCDPAPTVTCTPPSGSVFPTVTTTVTCVAQDDCLNTSLCMFDVTVNPVTEVFLDVELANVVGPTTRCIHFVSDDCGDTLDVELSFVDHDSNPATGVRFSGSVELACGALTQACAKDEQHTLYDTSSLSVAGTTFVADSLLSLVGGDNDNDSDVDINDVTYLLFTFGELAADGGCPWDGTRDADFSNNGAVLSEDYTFFTSNWLTFSSCACASPLKSSGGVANELGRTSISTADLSAPVSAAADLNTDGKVDYRDVELFEERHGLPRSLSQKIKDSESRIRAGR